MTNYKIDLNNIDVKDMLKELKQALRENKLDSNDTIIIIGARNPFEYNHTVDNISRWIKYLPVQFKDGE